jgi:hypothetical protein
MRKVPLFIIAALFLMTGTGYAQRLSERSFTQNRNEFLFNTVDYLNNRPETELNSVFPVNSSPKADVQDIFAMEPTFSGGGLSIMQCVDNTSSQDEWTNYTTRVYKQNAYLVDSIEYTLYQSDFTVEKTFTVKFDGLLTNAINMQQEYSRYLFNRNADREFVLSAHCFEGQVDPEHQTYKQFVVSETGAILHTFDNTEWLSICHVHNGSNQSTNNTTRRIVAAVYGGYLNRPMTNEDTTEFKVYSLTGLTTTAGSLGTIGEQATHRIGSKNMVGFQSPIINFVDVAGQTYYYFPHFEQPFWQDPISEGLSTPNNKGIIELFKVDDSQLYKHIELPMLNWSNAMQLSFGMSFGEYQFTSGVFGDGSTLDLMYGVREYSSECDCFLTTFHVADENGTILKSSTVQVGDEGGVTKLASVKGQNPLYAMGETSAIAIFDPIKWEVTTTFNAVHQGEQITSAFNRIPYGDDYAFLFTMYDVYKDAEGNTIQPVNFYDKEGVKIKTQNFNLGPNGFSFTPALTDATLNPYLINCDGKMEWIGFARLRVNPDATTGETFIHIYSEEGELLYQAGPGSEGTIAGPQGLWTMNGGKTFDYFRLTYSSGNTFLYKLPFDTQTEGDGTAENPYLISDAGQLDAIRLAPDAHYRIVNDIDMATLLNTKYLATGWVPLPDFKGTLDGQGFVIKNFKVYNFSADNLSMFTRLSGSAKIQNLYIDSAELSTSTASAPSRISFVAGEVTGTGTIRNVHVTGSRIALNSDGMYNGYVGAIAGGVVGNLVTIDQCSFDGVIESAATFSTGMIGGIVGDVRATAIISNCLSKGAIRVSVSGTSMMSGVGGIAGTLRGLSTIKNCYSTADITSLNSAGGIVGNFNEQGGAPKGLIENCYATGRIISNNTGANTFAGGLVGHSSTNNSHLSLNPSTYEFTLNKTRLNMSGLVALNDTVTAPAANRVSATNAQASGNIEAFGFATADSLRNIYALATLKVGAAGAEAEITSADATGFDGADKTAAEITETFLTEIGWAFGTDAEHPWLWIDGAYPKLWFEVAVQLVTLNADSVALNVTETHQLTATVRPEHAINKNVSWTSGDEAIATVSAEGLVTAVAQGTVTITVTTEDGGFTAECVVHVRPQYTVTLEANPAEGGEFTGDGVYNEGAEVTVTAIPATGYNFVNWTENGTEVSAEAEYKFNATANRTLVANFVLKTYTIAVSANPAVGGHAEGGNDYTHGAEVTVTATANTGYEFVNWTENNVQVSDEAEFVFTAESNRTLVAHFALQQFEVTYNMPANGILRVTSEGAPVASGTSVAYGTVLTVVATPNAGYELATLTINGEPVESGASYMVVSATVIECNFGTVGINKNSIAGVTIYGYQNNVYIVNENNVPLKSVQIVDMFGRVVYRSETHNSAVIPVDGANGYYAVQLISKDNKVSSAKVYLTK